MKNLVDSGKLDNLPFKASRKEYITEKYGECRWFNSINSHNDTLAQLVEPLPFKQEVVSSSLTWITLIKGPITQLVRVTDS